MAETQREIYFSDNLHSKDQRFSFSFGLETVVEDSGKSTFFPSNLMLCKMKKINISV